jgi:hypothetical protein
MGLIYMAVCENTSHLLHAHSQLAHFHVPCVSIEESCSLSLLLLLSIVHRRLPLFKSTLGQI